MADADNRQILDERDAGILVESEGHMILRIRTHYSPLSDIGLSVVHLCAFGLMPDSNQKVYRDWGDVFYGYWMSTVEMDL